MPMLFVVSMKCVIRSTAFVVLPVLLLICTAPAPAQEEREDEETNRVFGREDPSRVVDEHDAEARQKLMRRFESYGGVSAEVEQRRRAEEAQLLSLGEFLGKYNAFARKVKLLLEEMETNPSVVPVAKLREVQKAWVAWQKCREWPTAK